MKMKYMMAAMSALAIAQSASASTLLFADNFNEAGGNFDAATFNNNLAATQSGSEAPASYTVSGSDWRAQHSNGDRLLVASADTGDFGSVSLNYDFSTAANALNQALVFSFNISDVSGFSEASNWVAFSIGSVQNGFVTNGSAGLLFRQNGNVNYWTDGGTEAAGPTWSANDLVTITLSNTAGTGSAFNGAGSVAKIKVGSNAESVFTLNQLTSGSGYLTFNTFQTNQFGSGAIDNLSVTAVPEPSAALLGGLGVLGLLRRRRK